MKIVQRYVTASLVTITFIALLGLVLLFSFFSVIDQLEDAGSGNFGIPQALLYVFLTTPRMAYDLFPIAAVIGSMTALGVLAQNSELAVLRTSGVSRLQLAGILVRSALILVVIAVLIGEFIAPVSEQVARQRRSMALSEQIGLGTRYGYWAREGNSFINIRRILRDDRVEDINIYEFDDQEQLRNSIHAREAEFVDGRWLLRDIEQTSISPDGISSTRLELAHWESLFNPGMIQSVIIEPQHLTLWGLFGYIRFLEQNAQNTQLYEQALWTKLVKPFSIIAMILLAVPLVNCHARQVLVAQRVFMGALVGIVFHICNQTAGHLGVVYNIPPWFSVTVPTVVLLTVILYTLVAPLRVPAAKPPERARGTAGEAVTAAPGSAPAPGGIHRDGT